MAVSQNTASEREAPRAEDIDDMIFDDCGVISSDR